MRVSDAERRALYPPPTHPNRRRRVPYATRTRHASGVGSALGRPGRAMPRPRLACCCPACGASLPIKTQPGPVCAGLHVLHNPELRALCQRRRKVLCALRAHPDSSDTKGATRGEKKLSTHVFLDAGECTRARVHESNNNTHTHTHTRTITRQRHAHRRKRARVHTHTYRMISSRARAGRPAASRRTPLAPRSLFSKLWVPRDAACRRV
jgi:hypothetical protein